MRLSLVLFAVFAGFIIDAKAQIISEDITVEEVLVEQSIYLKGPFHQPINGRATSRAIFEIEIPENTRYLVYGYTTASGITLPDPLNLRSQIVAKTKSKAVLDFNTIRSLSLPEGKVEMNLYLMDKINRDRYLNHSANMNGDYRYFSEGTIIDQNNGLIVMTELPDNPLFIIYDLKSNTTALTGNLEVVAIVDTKTETIEARQRRALKLAEMGESLIVDQEYSKAFDYSCRSFKLFELGWVQANIGLTELALNHPEKALETYKEALELITRQPNEDFILEKLDKDLQRLKTNLGIVNGIEPIENLIAIFRE